jgi:hypothetical protein
MLTRDRQRRALVLEALDGRTKQFRSREDSWPFRMPHEPLDLDELIDDTLAGEDGRVPAEALRSRGVLRLEWETGGLWDLWVATLPSGLHLYCDSDGHETRVLASAKRGTPSEADGFFLERLAESRGHLFGIEMAGPPPDRVKSSIGDRDFLADVFVELFEGTDAERVLSAGCWVPGAEYSVPGAAVSDFRAVVVGWLERVLSAPPMTRRQPHVRDEDPSAL